MTTIAPVIDTTDDEFEIRFRYDPDVVAAIKDLPGRRWHSDRRCWTVPHASVRPLRQFATQFGFEFTDTALAVDDAPTPTGPVISAADGRFTIRFGYDRDLVARVRDIPSAYWSPRRRAWEIATDAVDDVARFAVATGATLDSSAVDLLSMARDAFDRIEASAATDADLNVPGLGGTLLPFQRAGVRYVLDALGRT